MRCAQCGAGVDLPPGGRVGFRDCCDACGADLHTCRSCAHHDPSAHNECREPNSEWVSDRDRANRCDWFRAGDPEGGNALEERGRAKAGLDALFKKT